MDCTSTTPPDQRGESLAAELARGERLQAEGELAAAACIYRRVLSVRPDLFRTAYNLGIILNELQQYAEAEKAFRHALKWSSGFFEAEFNLFFALQEQGRIDEALRGYTSLLERYPDSPDVRFNLACLQLLTGDTANGWPGYECRFDTVAGVKRRHEQIPLWPGTFVKGTRLLVHTEQGYGDAMQMVRYLPIIADAGIELHIETTRPLFSMFKGIHGIRSCFLRGDPLPRVDFQLPIMGLPMVMDSHCETLPATVPYLSAPDEATRSWRSKLPPDHRPRVGVAWAGRLDLPVNRKRSCPAGIFSRILDLSDIVFVSLQKETDPAFRIDHPNLIDFSSEIRDFGDTAALMAGLDLVITIDTSVAHLAGAMGRPTWLMLPHVPDWRWLMKREDSLWYPTMRLFRQPLLGDWEPVVREISAALTVAVAPSVYLYRPGIDFTPPDLLGERHVPLLTDGGVPAPGVEGMNFTHDPARADLYLFPYYLENLTEWEGIEGMWRFVSTLPYFSSHESRHLFFSEHDSMAQYHSSSIWFRASLQRERHDPAAFPLFYQTEDLGDYLCFDPARLRYHVSFVGFLGVRRQRAVVINGIAAESRLVSALDIADAFHGHQSQEVRDERRRRYLELSSQSIAILCPAGDGSNSIRFFEALSLGRLAVLVSDSPLPFEDRIDYDRFVLRISAADASCAGALLFDWLNGFSDQELLNRCREARAVWEKWFSPWGRGSAVRGQVIRHRLSGNKGVSVARAEVSCDRQEAVLLSEALGLISSGDLTGAETVVAGWVKLSPRSPKPYLMMGMLQKQLENSPEAEDYLNEAILYDHRCFDAYLELGMLLAETGREREAVERLFEASLVRPADVRPYQAAVPLLADAGRIEEARYCLTRLRELMGESPELVPIERLIDDAENRGGA